MNASLLFHSFYSFELKHISAVICSVIMGWLSISICIDHNVSLMASLTFDFCCHLFAKSICIFKVHFIFKFWFQHIKCTHRCKIVTRYRWRSIAHSCMSHQKKNKNKKIDFISVIFSTALIDAIEDSNEISRSCFWMDNMISYKN